MARGIEGNEIATPKPPTLKKSNSGSQSGKGQKSILGFFQKKADSAPTPLPKSSPSVETPRQTEQKFPTHSSRVSSSLTPAPSSDAIQQSSPTFESNIKDEGKNKENGLISPITPDVGEADGKMRQEVAGVTLYSSPSRKAKKTVNYAESDAASDDEEEVFKPISANATRGRASKRRKVTIEESDDDEFDLEASGIVEDDLDDFIVADNSDEEPVQKKRKRPTPPQSRKSSSRPPPSSPPPQDDEDGDLELPLVSTAKQWDYDPDHPDRINPSSTAATQGSSNTKRKAKAHESEPEKRHQWLLNVLDADRHPPDHPDYDPRTIYVPPLAFNGFSPFEKQYWEIKQKFWDTIVFFKKGKFYELYEKDATVGHQLFNLKLTDRVNMRMVGVPEASLDYWATQFVAKGYKIARVDQMETALGKEMRERDGGKPAKSKKEEKVIRRELASVLTAGTLVDGGMLQDDMATYCVAVKETERDGRPAFGIAFVDTATAQFQLSEFQDDADMTKFETFVAQIRPGELLLEKSCISAKALRILKNNTGPMTIWNYLKSGKEFWPGDITARELDASGYFVSPDRDDEEVWPTTLNEVKEKDVVMSAFGALTYYLRTLKIERELISLGNISWYDPIRKASSLVLDGQSLINLEIFANGFDGSSEGTLFSMLNRCITPFGKRVLRQWTCHPLADAQRINARLDAVDTLIADKKLTDRFTGNLSKLPDLERLISRIHAGRCRAQDFARVLDGLEQIEYTMSMLNDVTAGESIISQLISSMPDLTTKLSTWKDAFDRKEAKETDILVPEDGVEEDFDESSQSIKDCLDNLEAYLKQVRRDVGSQSIKYTDIGKEVYQLEVPGSVKKVPKTWDQMSATAKVKRYYTPELRKLVRALQEGQERHTQIIKEVHGRFLARFDEDYKTWLAATKVIAQLDCLISLAKASESLGGPSCRPTLLDETTSDRTVLEFEQLRHPCMPNVPDFIPNDVRLGGEAENIALLTGANAAGKSTILRMTCVAVILAQIGCHLPCASATITPIDRIMSRLGANDNIFAAQSTFFVELAETKKILSEATPRSLVILDELGRGTSSWDGLAVAQAALHHIASHVGCIGFFATHYHSLAAEFAAHPEIAPKRMAIDVDEAERRVTFLYKLETGVAEGSFGMHCASMCGIPSQVVERAEQAAREWEHTSRVKDRMEKSMGSGIYLPLGMQSDVAWCFKDGDDGEHGMGLRGLDVLRRAIETL